MRQIPLDLPLPVRLGADDFLRAPSNAAVLDALMSWPRWPDRIMLLVGPEGSGKSHLASIWAERARATPITGAALGRISVADAAANHVALDDADRVGLEEAQLFHLLNALRENGRSALLTARHAPDLWHLRTADLLSRLRLAPVLRPTAPDDALVTAVLVKLFADRQIAVDRPVVDYLVGRMERSIAAARQLVAALDRASLAAGRRITRAVAADVLASLQGEVASLEGEGASLDGEGASRHGDVTGVGENPGDP